MSGQLKMDEFMGSGGGSGGEEKIVSYGEAHLACALLLDVSGSMFGERIGSLNQALRRFKEQVCSDSISRQRVDIALVTFATDVEVISDFVPVTHMPTPALQAGGRTDMAKGIQTAINLVKNRTNMYHSLGTPCHKPWIFMITDGESTSSPQEMMDAADRVHAEEAKGSYGHLSFWALGVGEYNSKQLFSFTNRVIELRNQDFTSTFDWLSESMSTISQSRVGERVEFDPLPQDVRKAREDRAIGEDWY